MFWMVLRVDGGLRWVCGVGVRLIRLCFEGLGWVVGKGGGVGERGNPEGDKSQNFKRTKFHEERLSPSAL